MPFDKKAYDSEYIKKMIFYRKINFNRSKPDDIEIVEWIDSQPEGTSNYLKRLVIEDMGRQQK